VGIHIADEQLVKRIERIARRERREEVEVIAQAVELYEEKAQVSESRSFLLSIVGLGRSQERDISERDEEILSSEIDPIRGWDLGERS
jgi:uncharacterized protein (UPF0335 family)